MDTTRYRIVAALLLGGVTAACAGTGDESIAAAEAAERMRARAAAVGLWGDHDGWSVVQAPERDRRGPEEGEPTALL